MTTAWVSFPILANFVPVPLAGNTVCGSMNKKKLKKLKVEIRSLRAGSANIRDRQLIKLAKKLGRRLDADRGKHPQYVSDVFPRLRPVSIPSHPTALNPFIAQSILDQLDEDYLCWYERLNKTEEKG